MATAVRYIAADKFGAQLLVENPLAKKVLQGEFKEGEAVTVDASESGLAFRAEAVGAGV